MSTLSIELHGRGGVDQQSNWLVVQQRVKIERRSHSINNEGGDEKWQTGDLLCSVLSDHPNQERGQVR